MPDDAPPRQLTRESAQQELTQADAWLRETQERIDRVSAVRERIAYLNGWLAAQPVEEAPADLP